MERKIKGLDKEKTGENIKRLMRRSGNTTLDIQYALMLTTPATIYSWTQGKYTPNAESLVKLAQLFGCRVDDILALEEESENEE